MGVRAVMHTTHTSRWPQEARQRYREDAERGWGEEIATTGDMMRVTMLPILPLKVCIFTPRLIAHDTLSIGDHDA